MIFFTKKLNKIKAVKSREKAVMKAVRHASFIRQPRCTHLGRTQLERSPRPGPTKARLRLRSHLRTITSPSPPSYTPELPAPVSFPISPLLLCLRVTARQRPSQGNPPISSLQQRCRPYEELKSTPSPGLSALYKN